jgi:hypothetical protein
LSDLSASLANSFARHHPIRFQTRRSGNLFQQAAILMVAAFTAAVSVAEALVTGASEATDFGLVGFSEASIPATMAAITLAITDTAPAI